jgi:hypothetical protein
MRRRRLAWLKLRRVLFLGVSLILDLEKSVRLSLPIWYNKYDLIWVSSHRKRALMRQINNLVYPNLQNFDSWSKYRERYLQGSSKDSLYR